jgi:hypothetical protein
MTVQKNKLKSEVPTKALNLFQHKTIENLEGN